MRYIDYTVQHQYIVSVRYQPYLYSMFSVNNKIGLYKNLHGYYMI